MREPLIFKKFTQFDFLAPITTYTTSSLPVGSNSITAVYQGDTNFIASTSAVFPETVTGLLDFSVTAPLYSNDQAGAKRLRDHYADPVEWL